VKYKADSVVCLQAAASIAVDISERSMIGAAWEKIDSKKQFEIINTWAEIIKSIFDQCSVSLERDLNTSYESTRPPPVRND